MFYWNKFSLHSVNELIKPSEGKLTTYDGLFRDPTQGVWWVTIAQEVEQ